MSVRHSHCHDLLMPKATKLPLVECGQIVELHKQDLSQCAIAAEVGRSKTGSFKKFKMTEAYGKKVKRSTQKSFTGAEPEDPIGFLSRHGTILDPN